MALVRNKTLKEAKLILAFDTSRASSLILKTLKSAEANAKNNLSLNPNNLYISDLYVNGGSVRKSMRAAARGRSNMIIKRTSHIIVGLSEKGNK